MGLSGLRRLAAAAPPPVLALAGAGGASALAALRSSDVVDVVDSPRHATILLALGGFDGVLGTAAAQVHDQLPRPRLAVWLRGAGIGRPPPIPGLIEVDGGVDVGAAVTVLYRELVTGARPSTGDVLADTDPNDWRGVGPYGQGGKGMNGGVPYGRPMTGRAPDRDGLELDQLALRLGPWLSALPRGLLLDVHIQGDVIQEASVGANPFPGPPPPDLFIRALSEPVPLGDLERARAAHHLRWAAVVLRILGLRAMAARADRAAREPDARAQALAERLARATRLRPAMAGIGVVEGDGAARVSGPVGRAAGAGADARTDDPAYAGLGFVPVVTAGGDAWARWVVRLDEAARSLAVAAAAGDRWSTPSGVVESPRGPIAVGRPAPSAVLLEVLPPLLPGLEWGDATVAVASLDIDVEEAAVAASVPS